MTLEQIAPDAFDSRTECRVRQKTPGTHTHVCRRPVNHRTADDDRRPAFLNPHQCTCGHTW